MTNFLEEFVGWIVGLIIRYVKIPLWALIAIVIGIFLLGFVVFFLAAGVEST